MRAKLGVPQGWTLATFGEVTEEGVLQLGPTRGETFAYVDISSVDNQKKRIASASRISVKEAPSRARQVLEVKDLLVSMTRPNLNAVALVPDDLDGAIGSTGFHVLRACKAEPAWLFYATQTTEFIHAMSQRVQGALYPAVRPRDIRAYQLPLPPLAEQVRIADALDELFSDLDAGVAALERAREKLKLYRASVLKAAVEGALTAEWRVRHPHAEPASELLKRILVERRRRWEEDQLAKFKAKGQEPPKNWKAKYKEPAAPGTTNLPPLPEGWCWSTLGSLLYDIEAGKSFTCEPRPANQDEWGVIKVSAMSWGNFDEAENKAVPKGRSHDPYHEIRSGDLLLSRSNTVGLVGATVLVERCRRRLLLSDKSMRLLYSRVLPPKWLRYSLASIGARSQMSRMATGTSDSMRNISQESVSSVRMALPPIAEQEAIIEAVEDQLSVIDHLEADIGAKLKSAQALRQSILRHAFTGRLVPQDPNDEPASELLKRIAAEREGRAREAMAGKREQTRAPKPPRSPFAKGGGRVGRKGRG